jgi:hypothetical protein
MTIVYDRFGVTVHHADALAALRGMPAASVHAVVTDPPYGLTEHRASDVADAVTAWCTGDREFVPARGAGGFMGRDWDAFVPPPAVWDECLRVLKPGGHMLVFAGSRTVDLMGLSIRLAGFEIRDAITWLYGCHDDRTEVLTARGWVNGLDLDPDDEVAQWATDGTISLVQPTARQCYPFDGRLVRFRNADVDQLVTPNHRVYFQSSERTQVDGVRTAAWSDWRVEQAADVNRWQRMRLPASGTHDGPGIGGTDYAALLGWVWTEGGFDLSGTGVRIYQSSTNAAFVDEIGALLDRLGPHKRYDYERTWKDWAYTSTTWFISGDLARRVRADLPGKTPSWELLWRMTAAEKRALWDAAMKGDGSKGQRTFWQKDRAALEWVQALLAGIGCRGKIADDPRGALHWTDRPTVELQTRHLVDHGEDYTGEVWCVTVPSGAFIVRRNGRVSVSGNSGFPKSLDVSKAIDKAAGAEREVVGTAKAGASSLQRVARVEQGYRQNLTSCTPESIDITAPATDAAHRWSGWGTALKPASEPIIVARKPVVGTVAANVLEHGTGGINVDACRVLYRSEADRAQAAVPQPSFGVKGDGEGTYNYRAGEGRNGSQFDPGQGRWPTNVVFTHGPECTDECQDGCPVAELDAQSGTLKSGAMRPEVDRSTRQGAAYGTFSARTRTETYADSGGASRFFPTFRYEAKSPSAERPKVRVRPEPVLRMRADLTEQERAHVLAELIKAGVDVS